MEAGGNRRRVISAYDLGLLIIGTNSPSSPNSVSHEKAKLRTTELCKHVLLQSVPAKLLSKSRQFGLL